VEVSRNGIRRTLTLTPAMDSETGAGYIGVYPWVDPVVEHVEPGSPAAVSGMQAGDRIVSVEGIPVEHSLDIGSALERNAFPVTLTVTRDGTERELVLPAPDSDPGEQSETPVLGVAFETVSASSPDLNLFQAIGRGATESLRILVASVRSLRLLFRGVRITSAVAGPVRISYFIGDVATSGFSVGFGVGLRALAEFLALLSVVLFFMNLLPIPVLDGGQIILAGIEWIRGKTPHPRAVYRYQLIGGVVIFGLLFVALFGDILFLAGR
jgi:regulator of sigma E protease